MRGGKEQARGAGLKERAGRFAHARRDARGVAGEQIEDVDLIEWVPFLALALEADAVAIGAEVALAGALALEGELARIGKEAALLRAGLGPRRRGKESESGEETEGSAHTSVTMRATRARRKNVLCLRRPRPALRLLERLEADAEEIGGVFHHGRDRDEERVPILRVGELRVPGDEEAVG